MEIPLFETGQTLKFERVVLYPYPDNKRIWARVWLTAVPDMKPNLELLVLNPDGSENASVFMMEHGELRAETTLHLRNAIAGETYHVIVELSTGKGDTLEVLDRREFDMLLEFRNPDKGDPGFGFGVDWDEIARKRQDAQESNEQESDG